MAFAVADLPQNVLLLLQLVDISIGNLDHENPLYLQQYLFICSEAYETTISAVYTLVAQLLVKSMLLLIAGKQRPTARKAPHKVRYAC